MPTWTGAWSEDEAESYLAEATVPIRLACRTPSGGPWMLSLWYRYDDGAFHCATGANADVVEYLRADSKVAFEVSDNEPPYRGVRGAGTATIELDDDKALLAELLVRYLGGTDNDLATRLLNSDRQEVRIRIEPSKLYTWDFSERMADIT
ncbi:MAG: pyridoxamine 5'-phosphate oxidase family protein [Halobacteriota archaeon]|uniref:pyridoxamine 5'-phosphate oxidase family protein n=1 Tax=Natronomonas sp. TaxID=2184060 RepID=UPI0039752AE6